MNAFVRISDKEIRLRSQVAEPDYLLIVDPTLMRGFDVFFGLRENGIVLVNQKEETPPPPVNGVKVYSVPANDIAMEVIGRPLGNTALLGGFAAGTGQIILDDLATAIRQRFSGKIAEQNVESARRGFEYLKEHYQ